MFYKTLRFNPYLNTPSTGDRMVRVRAESKFYYSLVYHNRVFYVTAVRVSPITNDSRYRDRHADLPIRFKCGNHIAV